MITDPRFAPKRTDLPFLQRRRAPRAAPTAPTSAPPAASAAAPSAPSAPSAPPASAVSAVHDFLAGGGTRRHHPEPATPAAPAAAPVRPAPAPSSGLDLDAPSPSTTPIRPTTPTTPTAPAGAPGAGSAGLDLSAPTAPPTSSAPSAPTAPAVPPASTGGGSGLDLDLGGVPAPPRPAPVSGPRRTRPVARIGAGRRHIITVAEPTITFTRLQSGVGALRFEAACGAQVGDLRLGALYELNDGYSSSLQLTQGSRVAPPRSRRPVLVAGRDRFEEIAVDLRQNQALRRLAVYAFSESRAALNWGGTLIAETFGGARVELPLEGLPPQDTAVLMSLYNVDGEFVVRAEMQAVVGGARAAAAAFGYDRITWLDDRTPVE